MWSEVGCIPQGNAAPASLDVTQLSELQALNLKLVYLGDKWSLLLDLIYVVCNKFLYSVWKFY